MQYETVRQKLQNTSTSEILRARVPKGQRIQYVYPHHITSLHDTISHLHPSFRTPSVLKLLSESF